jgi:hypothetical protein
MITAILVLSIANVALQLVERSISVTCSYGRTWRTGRKAVRRE